MNRQEHIIEIPELLGNRVSKRLIFNPEGLTIEKPFSIDEPVFIPAGDITGFRLGIRWLRGLYFVMGRQFVVELRYQNNAKAKVKFTSIYSMRDQKYDEVWASIVNHLYNYYILNQLYLYIELYEMGQTFQLGDLTFQADGITWDKNKKLNFNQISLSHYLSYFVVHNTNNPRENVSFNFFNDWNAYLLQALLKYIVEERKKILSR